MTTRWFRLIQTMLLCAEAREEAERGRVVHEASLTESSLQSAARNLGVLARPMPCNLMADALVLPSRWRSSDRMCAASAHWVHGHGQSAVHRKPPSRFKQGFHRDRSLSKNTSVSTVTELLYAEWTERKPILPKPTWRPLFQHQFASKSR